MRTIFLLAICVFSVNPSYSQSYPATTSVGFNVVNINGVTTALWYPTSVAAKEYYYRGTTMSGVVAPGAPVTTTSRFPLVVLSHGNHACGTNSVMFTEELARRGYVVAAPDHNDARCSSTGSFSGTYKPAAASYFNPYAWTDATYVDRRDDIKAVISGMLAHPEYGRAVDPNRIVAAGHSLGGYTQFGIAGGWDSWYDSRVKALLLFSPYIQPYVSKNRVPSVRMPVMYQGGTLDFPNTASVANRGGAYDRSNAPKYFVNFTNQEHMDWTNFTCGSATTVPSCASQNENVKMINEFSFRFLDKHVCGNANALTTTNPVSSAAIAEYRAQIQ